MTPNSQTRLLGLLVLTLLGCGGESPNPLNLGASQQPLLTPIPLLPLQNAPGGEVATLLLGRVGDTVLLIGGNQHSGNELWGVQVSGAGGGMVRDLFPGLDYGFGYVHSGLDETPPFAATANLAFFFADDGRYGAELWASDGTAPGTRLVKNLTPGGLGTVVPTAPLPMAATTGRVFFNLGNALWTSDGTESGTVTVRDFPSGALDDLHGVGSRLVFRYTSTGDLWSSDGTPDGTSVLRSAGGQLLLQSSELTRVGDLLYFSASDGVSGEEPWQTDGTQAGTVRVADVVAGSDGSAPRDFIQGASGAVIFTAFNGSRRALFKHDRAVGGAEQLVDGETPPLTCCGRFADTDLGVVFTQPLSNETELWRVDRSSGEVARVTTVPGEVVELRSFRHGALLTAGSPSGSASAYFTDGTAEGTLSLSAPAQRMPAPFLIAGPLAFFETGGSNRLIGRLFQTDGTPEGTRLVPGFNAFGSGVLLRPPVFMSSGTGVAVADGKLLRTDGTVEGSYELLTVGHFNMKLLSDGRQAYFNAYAGTGADFGQQIFASDGTDAGTRPLSQFPPALYGELFALAGGKVYAAMGAASARDLWVVESDGTSRMLEVAPDAGMTFQGGVELGGRLLFFATLPESTTEQGLYVTDGSDAGTELLTTVPNYQRAPFGAAANGRFYFLGLGYTLWRTDGTKAGTERLSETANGAYYVPSLPDWITAVGDTIYFAATSPTQGSELWKSDGTVEGTVQVLDLNPTAGARPDRLAAWGDRLVFLADDGVTGRRLYVTDGTAAGTRPIDGPPTGFDLFGGGLRESIFAVPGGPILFPGGDEDGAELWASYGTAETTSKIADLLPGPQSSNPRAFVLDGERAYFIATTETSSTLFVMTVPRNGETPGADGGSGGGGSGGGAGPPEPPVDTAPTGCGCASGTGALLPFAILGMVAALRRRRRRG